MSVYANFQTDSVWYNKDDEDEDEDEDEEFSVSKTYTGLDWAGLP